MTFIDFYSILYLHQYYILGGFMAFDGASLIPGFVGRSEVLSFIGIGADDLRCLTDEDLRKLILKKCRELARLYEKGSLERKKVVRVYRLLSADFSTRELCKKEMLSEVLEISAEYLKNGPPVTSLSFRIIDIFKTRFCNDSLYNGNVGCAKLLYSFNEGKELFVSSETGRGRKKITDRRVVGCVRYGTRPYSLLEELIKKRAISSEAEHFINAHGRRYKEIKIKYDGEKAKNLPIEIFPFGIEEFIYTGIEEHAILLSLKEDNVVIPEGKIEGIYLR